MQSASRLRDRLARTAALTAAVTFTALLTPARPQSRPHDELFDPVAVVQGIVIDRAACSRMEREETAIWVTVAGHGACIRYYAGGLAPAPGPNGIAVAWMNGDVLGPKGDNADKRQKGFGPPAMVAQEQRLSARFGVPFLFLARPGTYGSAGRHYTVRGRPLEADLIAAALDGLKSRYGIQAWALAGHSGGGTLVAEMLARRTDVTCAVIASGAAAYRAYLEARGLAKPGDRLNRFDPLTSVDRIAARPERRIFVLGDPRETNVPFSSQMLYFTAVMARGHAAWLIPLARATDARHHDLVDFGETAAGLCAAGAATPDILRTLTALPDPPPRITN